MHASKQSIDRLLSSPLAMTNTQGADDYVTETQIGKGAYGVAYICKRKVCCSSYMPHAQVLFPPVLAVPHSQLLLHALCRTLGHGTC
jgi:hypothetical protein